MTNSNPPSGFLYEQRLVRLSVEAKRTGKANVGATAKLLEFEGNEAVFIDSIWLESFAGPLQTRFEPLLKWTLSYPNLEPKTPIKLGEATRKMGRLKRSGQLGRTPSAIGWVTPKTVVSVSGVPHHSKAANRKASSLTIAMQLAVPNRRFAQAARALRATTSLDDATRVLAEFVNYKLGENEKEAPKSQMHRLLQLVSTTNELLEGEGRG